MDLRNRFYYSEQEGLLIDFARGEVFKNVGKNGRKINYWRKAGFNNGEGYIKFKYHNKRKLLHRFIYEKFYRIKLNKKQQIDHQNHIKDDNRIVNLKLTDHQGNMQNMTKRRNTSSKYIGVCWNKKDKIFMSGITNPSTNKREYLGSFDNEKEAAMAYINKAEQLNKIYNANFNIPYLKSLLQD